MTFRILWPLMRWPDERTIELESVAPDGRAEFCENLSDVTEEQWRNCHAIVSYVDIPADYRAMIENCRIFVTPKVGFDNIDLEAWGELGIAVSNVPDYGTMEVADHAIALMLTLMKAISFHNDRLRDDVVEKWKPSLNPFGRRLSNCTFGIVGCGRIGTAAALRAKAFGMDVVFYDPYLPNGSELALGVRRVHSLAELFSTSDVVSLHAPLSDETRNLIDGEVLSQARPGLILINTARGEVVDLDALYTALESDQILAAGLDVLPQEPPDPKHPLLEAYRQRQPWLEHRLLLTPHSAFYTPESARDMRFKGGEVAMAYLRDGRLENLVNREFLKQR